MLYEVHLTSGEIVYLSYDLSVIIKGEVFRTKDNVNETALSREILMAEKKVADVLNGVVEELPVSTSVLNNSPSKSLISNKPKNEVSEKVANEFAEFTNNNIQPSSQTEQKSKFKTDDDFEALKARIQARIDKRKKEIAPITSADSVKTESSSSINQPSLVKQESKQEPKQVENEYRTKSNIDVNHIKQDKKTVNYKGQVLTKIGFDRDGNKLNVEDTKKQMVNFVKNIQKTGDKWSIVYPSTNGESKGEVTVFTDPTCGYCKKFHARLNEVTDKGYTVRYLFYPRYLAYGMEHPSAKKNLSIIKSIWCADDRKEEAHNVYVNNTMGGFTCENKPVEDKLFPATDHFLLGEVVGVEATPTVILPDGTKVAGIEKTLAGLK